MATYAEMREVFASDSAYRTKVEAAIVDQASIVILEADGTANHAQRIKLAFKVVEDVKTWSERFAKVILTKNKAFTIAQITAATDSAVLTEVAAFWDEFALQYGV